MIKFGTGGWRAVIAEDFTFSNVRRVAQAVALYLQELGQADLPVVVGHDLRFLSGRFPGRWPEHNGIKIIIEVDLIDVTAVQELNLNVLF